MSWSDCTVFLNGTASEVYYAGDLVTGTVSLTFKRKQKIDHIICKILGISKASWTRPMPTIPYIKIYSDSYTIIDTDIDIFDDYIGKTIHPGIEARIFNFYLPLNLPSSFKSSIATVQYFVVIQSKSGCRSRKKKLFPFTVYGKVSLSHLEQFVTPTFYEFQKKFWLSGNLSVNLKAFTGFAPKQHIPFEVLLTNEKRVKISKIKLSLIQKIKYSITAGYADEEIHICKVENKVSRNGIKEKCSMNMDIPQVPPSSIYLDDPMIGISYVFRIEISCQFHRVLQEDINVTVSTVPVIYYDDEALISNGEL